MKRKTDIEFLRSSPKHLLIYSYEDDLTRMNNTENFLKSIADPNFARNKYRYIGSSKINYDILIVRDPFNMFASRLKKIDSLTGSKNVNSIVMNWRSLALEAKKRLESKDKNKLVINFNEWFIDKEYRIRLSQKINGDFSDYSLNIVAGQGGGSSFDLMKHSPLTFRSLIEKREKLLKWKTYTRISSYIRRMGSDGAQSMEVLVR